MQSKKKKASAAATTEAGCEKASEVCKTSIAQPAKKSKCAKKSREKRKCRISYCEGKLCCADCKVEKCKKRCLNTPEKCNLLLGEEGADN